MLQHGMEESDGLVVSLYPFEATIAKADCTRADAIENIDIGGPAMLRAAAKNHAWVAVLTDPADYAAVLAEIDAGRSEEHTSELQSLMRISYAVFCLKKKKKNKQ